MKSSILKESLEVSTEFLFRGKKKTKPSTFFPCQRLTETILFVWHLRYSFCPAPCTHVEVGGGGPPFSSDFLWVFWSQLKLFGLQDENKGWKYLTWVIVFPLAHRPQLHVHVVLNTLHLFHFAPSYSQRVCHQVLKILKFFYNVFPIFTGEGC